jgi:hypothetical protein
VKGDRARDRIRRNDKSGVKSRRVKKRCCRKICRKGKRTIRSIKDIESTIMLLEEGAG